MTTRAQLLAIIRESLNVTSQWPDAIKDYSNYFPYIVEKTYSYPFYRQL